MAREYALHETRNIGIMLTSMPENNNNRTYSLLLWCKPQDW